MTSEANPVRAYIDLHGHTGLGSPYDGLDGPVERVTAAIEHGMNTVAITEHGNMNSLAEFVNHVKALNKTREAEGKPPFKPIYGVEAYFIKDLEAWKAAHARFDELKEQKLVKKAPKKTTVLSDDITDTELEDVSGWLPAKACKDDVEELLATIKEKRHILLLAKNPAGLKNLFRLVSYSHDDDHFYRFPRIDWALLNKYKDGLIVSSACQGGLLGGLYFRYKEKGEEFIAAEIDATNRQFQEVFGEDYYNEIQANSVEGQWHINQHIIASAKRLGIKLLATTDSHFPRKEQWVTRQMYSKMKWMRGNQAVEPDWPANIEAMPYRLWLQDGDEVYQAFRHYCLAMPSAIVNEAINNTLEVADKIELFYPDTNARLPSFACETDDPDREMAELCFEGLEALGKGEDPVYVDRMCHELETIISRGFSKYFLTMRQITRRARAKQLAGPARGSAGASLVAYCLGITQIDPIQFDLDFGRFMTKGSSGYPDIDFDVEDPALFKEQLIEEWGKHSVAYVSNWNRLSFKSLLKDIAKFFNVPFEEVNHVTKLMIAEIIETVRAEESESEDEEEREHEITEANFKVKVEHLGKSPTYADFIAKYPYLQQHIEGLLGQVRDVSTHAGGIIIGDDLFEELPLIRKNGKMQTPWPESGTNRALESMGHVKFDVLGVNTLEMVRNALAIIAGTSDFKVISELFEAALNPANMDLDDLDVWENVYGNGRFLGVFQATSKGMQEFIKNVKPRDIIELSACSAIFRPGPMAANVHEDYVKAKWDGEEAYYHDLHRQATEATYGFLVFQEQIANVVHLLGDGITMDEGHLIRKLLTSKGEKQKLQAQSYKEKFVNGCTAKGMDLEVIENLWESIVAFSGYGFNKSHAVGYSIISYWCAWLSHHYPHEWAAAYLQKTVGKIEDMAAAISLVKNAGFRVLHVDVNRSGRAWEVVEDDQGRALLPPLGSIKGLGEKAIDTLIEHRPIRWFSSFFDGTIPRATCNKRVLSALLKAGTLDFTFSQIPGFINKKQLITTLDADSYKNIEHFYGALAKVFVEDYTIAEMMEIQFEITGMYPTHMIITPAMQAELDRLADEGLMPLSEVAAMGNTGREEHLAWFIVRDYTKRKTTLDKPFWVVQASDIGDAENRLCVWSTDKGMLKPLKRHSIYVAKVRVNEYGPSTDSKKLQLVTTEE